MASSASPTPDPSDPSSSRQFPTNLKLLLIGNSSVGKSSLLLRFTDDDFLADEETSATIGVDFKVKALEVEGRKYKLSIWDTAGQERFRTLTSSYYRGAQGVILVYDVSSRQSFQSLSGWFRELSNYCSPEVAKMIVGNKVDKEALPGGGGSGGGRQVPRKEAEEYAKRMGCQFIECSAKTNVGVVEAFQELVQQIIDTPSLWSTDSRVRQQQSGGSSSTSDIVRIVPQDQDQDGMPGGWGSSVSNCSC